MIKNQKADRNQIFMNYPSSWWGAKWREALPSGNGAMGAAVYGGVNHERIMLTHGDLWWKSQTPPLPDISDKLSEVRDLLNRDKPFEANDILVNTLIERDYNPVGAVPLPLGDLTIMMPNERAF